jgi:hypothetical protein
MKTPYVKNCNLITRDTDDVIFHGEPDEGLIHPYLDGYTILPNEQYEKLVDQLPVGTRKT